MGALITVSPMRANGRFVLVPSGSGIEPYEDYKETFQDSSLRLNLL